MLKYKSVPSRKLAETGLQRPAEGVRLNTSSVPTRDPRKGEPAPLLCWTAWAICWFSAALSISFPTVTFSQSETEQPAVENPTTPESSANTTPPPASEEADTKPEDAATDLVKGLPPEYKIKDEWPIPEGFNPKTMRSRFKAILGVGKFNNQDEEQVLELGIKYHLAMLTHVSERANLSRRKNEILGHLRQTQPPNVSDLQVHDRYLEILVSELPKLLENNVYVRETAAVILENMNLRDADPSVPNDKATPYLPAVQLMLEVVNDKKQMPAVKFPAVRGLVRVFDDPTVSPQTRFLVVRAFLGELKLGSQLPEPYLWRLMTALGQVKQIEDGNGRPTVAQELMRVVVDDLQSWRTRVIAAHTLSRIPLESSQGPINLELVSIELVRLAKDMAEDYSLQPDQPHWKDSFFLLYLAFNPGKAEKSSGEGFLEQVSQRSALKTKYEAISNEAYKQILPLVNKIVLDSEKVDFDKQLQQMEKWLTDHPQKSDRIAPNEEPILTQAASSASASQ